MLSNNWRMSIPMLKTKIECQCKHCENWMGKEHDYSFCYKNKRGLKLVCTDELKETHPMDVLLYQKISNEFNKSLTR